MVSSGVDFMIHLKKGCKFIWYRLIELVLLLYLNQTSRSHGGKLRGQCVFKE